MLLIGYGVRLPPPGAGWRGRRRTTKKEEILAELASPLLRGVAVGGGGEECLGAGRRKEPEQATGIAAGDRVATLSN